MDFPQLSHQYGADGIGLLLVPAWDFILDGWLHGRMAIMRGVESGFTIARAAKQGELTVTDDRGRLLADWNQGGNQFVSISADAPVRHDSTLYVRWGDWFAWTVIAALAFLLLSLLYS
jgi:apolipoprotein N-acyltransferase